MGLTNAERQRRYITKLKAQASVSNGAGDSAELQKALTRIEQLEEQIYRLSTRGAWTDAMLAKTSPAFRKKMQRIRDRWDREIE